MRLFTSTFSPLLQEYPAFAGGGGVGSMAIGRFLNVDYDALHFHTGSLKMNIFQSSPYSFWE